MNMSAMILREIVASVLMCDAREVILSGVINPDTKWEEDRGHSWDEKAGQDYYRIFGFNSESGLKKLDISMSSAYSDNGSSVNEGNSESLAEYLDRKNESYIFFVVHHYGRSYGKEGEEFNTFTIYKSPNFKEYWEKVTEKDIARWEQWLEKE